MKLGALLLYRKLLGNGAGSCFGIFFSKIWWWFFRTTKILTPHPKSPHFHKKTDNINLPCLVATPPSRARNRLKIIYPSRPSRKSPGSCGSSWAFAATAVASFRECLSLLHRGFVGSLFVGNWHVDTDTGGGLVIESCNDADFFWFKVYIYIYINTVCGSGRKNANVSSSWCFLIFVYVHGITNTKWDNYWIWVEKSRWTSMVCQDSIMYYFLNIFQLVHALLICLATLQLPSLKLT